MKLWKLQVILILVFGSLAVGGCSQRKQAGLFEAGGGTEGPETAEDSRDTESVVQSMQEDRGSGQEAQTEGMIYVQVCGAVNQPGVVTLPAGSRVFEAILLAGGLTQEAAENSVNQAQVLADGQQIMVWTREEMQEKEIIPGEVEIAGTDSEDAQEKKVNLNTATAQELMTLSGIGEAKAADILAYREQNGGFQSIEDIMKIRGIKEAIFERIKDQITVS